MVATSTILSVLAAHGENHSDLTNNDPPEAAVFAIDVVVLNSGTAEEITGDHPDNGDETFIGTTYSTTH